MKELTDLRTGAAGDERNSDAHLELAIYHRGRAHSYAEVCVKLRMAIEIETHRAVLIRPEKSS